MASFAYFHAAGCLRPFAQAFLVSSYAAGRSSSPTSTSGLILLTRGTTQVTRYLLPKVIESYKSSIYGQTRGHSHPGYISEESLSDFRFSLASHLSELTDTLLHWSQDTYRSGFFSSLFRDFFSPQDTSQPTLIGLRLLLGFAFWRISPRSS